MKFNKDFVVSFNCVLIEPFPYFRAEMISAGTSAWWNTIARQLKQDEQFRKDAETFLQAPFIDLTVYYREQRALVRKLREQFRREKAVFSKKEVCIPAIYERWRHSLEENKGMPLNQDEVLALRYDFKASPIEDIGLRPNHQLYQSIHLGLTLSSVRQIYSVSPEQIRKWDVLDTCCGPADVLEMLFKGPQFSGRKVGIDISAKMIDLVRHKGFEGVVSNVCEITFTNCFDLVINSFAIDRVDRPITMLERVAQAAKREGNGKVLVMSPIPILHQDKGGFLQPKEKKIIGGGDRPWMDAQTLIVLLRSFGLTLRAWTVTTCLQKDPFYGLLKIADLILFLENGSLR